MLFSIKFIKVSFVIDNYLNLHLQENDSLWLHSEILMMF